MAKSQVLERRCIDETYTSLLPRRQQLTGNCPISTPSISSLYQGRGGDLKKHQSILDTNSMCLKWCCSGHVTSDVAEKDWVAKSEIFGVFQILCLYTYATANAILVSQLSKWGQGILMIWELWSHVFAWSTIMYIYSCQITTVSNVCWVCSDGV